MRVVPFVGRAFQPDSPVVSLTVNGVGQGLSRVVPRSGGRREVGPRLPPGSRSHATLGQTKVQWLCAGRPRALLLLQKRPRAAPPDDNNVPRRPLQTTTTSLGGPSRRQQRPSAAPPCDCGAVAQQRHRSPAAPSAFLESDEGVCAHDGHYPSSSSKVTIWLGRAGNSIPCWSLISSEPLGKGSSLRFARRAAARGRRETRRPITSSREML